jgi:hypothetical protein
MFVRLLGIIIFLGIFNIAFTNTGSKVQLTVEVHLYDFKRTDLDSVSVMVEDLNTGELYFDKSDFDGMAYIKLDLDKFYQITFQHPDFFTKTVEFNTETPGKRLPRYTLEFEVVMFHNCKKNGQNIIYREPIALVVYDKRKRQFEFDMKYTDKAKKLFEEAVDEICPLKTDQKVVARQYKKEQKIREQIAKEKAAREKELQIVEEKKQDIFSYEEEDKYNVFDTIVEEVEIVVDSEKEEKQVLEPKNKVEKFDAESNSDIYISAESNWVTLVQRKMTYPEEKIMIGKYSYSLQGEKFDIYVDDVEELRKKFQYEFNQAFPNFDRIYKGHL